MMTDDDVELYLLHSRLPAFQKKVQRSLSLLEEAKNELPGTWGISYSGGKDSTVAFDLAFQVFGDSLGVVWQSYGKETLPGNREMVEWVKSEYKLNCLEYEAPGELDAMKRAGHFFLEPETKEEREAVAWWWRESFRKLSKITRKELGWSSHIMGLRSEESNRRRMSIGKHGVLFYNQTSKQHECLPIARWTGMDVWAYIVSHGLKYNSIYDCGNVHQQRDRIRNDIVMLSGTGSIRHGQFAFFRKLWPEWFASLCKDWPELRRYT